MTTTTASGSATTRAFPQRFGGAALITGASSGIGTAFAQALAARGMDVVLVARRRDRLEQLAAELASEHRVRALALALDLTEPDAAQWLEQQTRESDMPVGLLVNNAGFGAYGDFAELDGQTQMRMVDLNCRAVVSLTHTFLPAMLQRGRGGIVLVASIAGFQPTPYLTTYGATKAFDLMLAEALWAELRPRGVEVLGLCPGFVRTEFQQVAGSSHLSFPGSVLSPEQVVASALDALGSGPSHVPGLANKLLVASLRLGSRRLVATLSRLFSQPKERETK